MATVTRPAPALRHPNRHPAAFTIADLRAAQICREAGVTTEIAATAAEKLPELAPLAEAMTV